MSGRPGVAWAARLGAPAVALAPPLALVWWALPESLPLGRSIAIVSAWAGTGSLVASLLLMLREPRLARLLGGLETSYRWHHRSGVLAYLLLLIHPLALAADGWIESPRLAAQVLAPWAHSWPVWLGWAALGLLMAGLASTFAPRLPYRVWRRFHLLLGLAVVLGFGHVYALLGEVGPVVALIAVGILALGWRLIVSDLGVGALPYRVTTVANRATGMIEASLAPCGAALAVSPGQFILAAFGDGPHYHGCGEYHPFTVSNIGANDQLQVTVKALGPCSRRLQALEPGVLVRLQGPFGRFLGDISAAPQLWIAGGVGITPFIAALRAGPRIRDTTLIYLHRSAADAAFVDELIALAAEDPRFEVVTEASGDQAPDVAPLFARVSHLAEREAHLCGPPAMVDTFIAHLRECGIPPRAIHFERFDFR